VGVHALLALWATTAALILIVCTGFVEIEYVLLPQSSAIRVALGMGSANTSVQPRHKSTMKAV